MGCSFNKDKFRRPESKEPINLRLLDLKNEVDSEIKQISNRILKATGMDNLTDGSK
ncbi:MAG: hypothetical protein ACYDIA_15700 [Candidatus Humimicrobiaceae bacterium]